MSEIKHYRHTDGTYLGQYDEAPDGGIETPVGPSDAAEVWDGAAWSSPLGTSQPVPAVVSAFQAKAALMTAVLETGLNAGLYDKAAVAAQAAGGLTWLAWQTATEFQRSSPAIATLASALDLTDERVDELFIAAAKIIA